MIIKILGSGCKKCITLTENTQAALANLGREAQVIKVTDFAEIAAYGVITSGGPNVTARGRVAGRSAPGGRS